MDHRMRRTSFSDDMVVIDESSEDEIEMNSNIATIHAASHIGNLDQTEAQVQGQRQSTDIRSRVESARLLLQAAELLSRPESTNTGSQPSTSSSNSSNQRLSRYAISRNVVSNDFYRERDLASLCDVASELKNRLSVERIYNLGPPQCEEERSIFDELLMTRFSDLITGEQDIAVSSHDNNAQSSQNQSRLLSDTSSQQCDRTVALETDLSVAQAVSNSNSSASVNGLNVFDSSRMLDTVRNLRQYIEQSPEAVVSDREMVSVVSEFIHYLKRSPVLSSAIAFSPPTTPSKPRKRHRNDEGSDVKDTKNDEGTDDEEESCTICLEPWTTGGDHRICCLKCGHMFGYSCICKWIKQAHSCPQCKVPAKKDDIRNLFARKLTVEDTSERDRAYKLLEEERAKARSLEHKEALARREIDTQSRLITTLEARLAHITQEGVGSSQGRPEGIGAVGASGRGSVNPSVSSSSGISSLTKARENSKYQLLARISIMQDGLCRVFEHSKELGMVIVSTKSPNPLFKGFGIKTLARDFRVLSYQPLHSALIRDLSFRPNTYDGTLLSCGMDKVVQLTSVTSKSIIQKFTLNASGWCCSWNTSDNNYFYVGMERGQVKEFDVRRTDGPVQDVLDLGGAPIASVAYWDEQSHSGPRSIKGLLIGHIRNLIFREKRGEEFFTHALPCPQAPIMGSCFTSDGHFLTSYRPSGNNPRCQYEVCRLMWGREDNLFSHKIKSWEGATHQPVISRNCLFADPDSEHYLYAATANHQSNTVSLWDVQRGSELQSLNCFNKAYDIKPISSNQQELLGVLSESELILYKWSKSSGPTRV